MSYALKSYPKIDSVENFAQFLNERGRAFLKELEPDYAQKYDDCLSKKLPSKKIHEICDPLLTGRLNKLTGVMEALYEVRYSWKRLTEVARLLGTVSPSTFPEQMDDSQWFVYNLDFYWQAYSGLFEHLVTLLTRLDQCFKLDEIDRKRLEVYARATRETRDGVQKIRGQLAHMKTEGAGGIRSDHEWEASLLSNDRSDFVETYDERMAHDKDFYLNYILKWVGETRQAINTVFTDLCGFELRELR